MKVWLCCERSWLRKPVPGHSAVWISALHFSVLYEENISEEEMMNEENEEESRYNVKKKCENDEERKQNIYEENINNELKKVMKMKKK
jgi:hypothetical protein